jgi:hypothetical protein
MTGDVLSLDIGFDREALVDPGDEGRAALTSGFTVVSHRGNPVALARRLKKRSRLLLTLYDLTGGPSMVTVDFLSLRLDIDKAREQRHAQPFELLGGPLGGDSATTSWEVFRIFRDHAETGSSTVFDAAYPSWHVHPPDGDLVRYPLNQLGPGPQGPEATFELAYDGRFNFTIFLEVHWVDGSQVRHEKSYRQDPEMIIDTTL